MSQAASTTQSAAAAPVGGNRRPLPNDVVGGVGVMGTTMSARYGETEWEAREVCDNLFYLHKMSFLSNLYFIVPEAEGAA